MHLHDRGEAQLEKVDGLGVTVHFVLVALEASSVGYVPMQMGQPGQGRRLLSIASNEVIETGGEAGRDGRCGYTARVQVSVVCLVECLSLGIRGIAMNFTASGKEPGRLQGVEPGEGPDRLLSEPVSQKRDLSASAGPPAKAPPSRRSQPNSRMI